MQVRRTLREKLKKRLLSETKAGDRIDINPQLFEFPYPYIELSTPSDEGDLVSNSIEWTEQKLTIAIDLFDSTDGENIYNRLDDLSLEVEKLIEADPTFDKSIISCLLINTQMGKNDDGEGVLGFLRLTYECIYMKRKTLKRDLNLPKFNGIKIGETDA